MDLAYAMADLVICRAGALTISELAQIGQAAVLIPSPNVAEDHQTKNAQALASRSAAVLLPDEQAKEEIIRTALQLLEAPEKREALQSEIRKMARPRAAAQIAEEVLGLVEGRGKKVEGRR
jgi:UDP-N-acetylglucosamine--N-acetylmuramyl-(pentapeptide) pyrophosphoryl-undecaprenol N-acetylglucosamine transferase